MSEYPYAHVSAKLKDFLDKIPSTGVPDKVTYNELAARGFKSTNDRSILSVLKFLVLVDNEGVPTENWTLYRNKGNNKLLLAELTRKSYLELFAMYPNAYERTDEEIRNFIASKTKVGEDTIQRIVTTFKMLCSMSEFSTVSDEPEDLGRGEKPANPAEQTTDGLTKQKSIETAVSIPASVAQVSINLHIHLPETESAEAAAGLIRSIAHYLLGREV